MLEAVHTARCQLAAIRSSVPDSSVVSAGPPGVGAEVGGRTATHTFQVTREVWGRGRLLLRSDV